MANPVTYQQVGGGASPPPNYTATVNHVLGNAYLIVRFVALRMPWIKAVNDNIAAIQAVAGSLETLEGLTDVVEKLPELLALQAELDKLVVLYNNLTQLVQVADNITDIQAVADNLAQINIVATNIAKVGTVADNIVAINGVYDNLAQILNVNANVDAILMNTAEAIDTANTALSTANGIDAKATQALADSSTALNTTASFAGDLADAQSAASAAQGTANTAVSNAATAQSTANTAVSDAAMAQGTANTALANAATAQSTANTAVSNAAAAQSTANTAVSNAAAAQSTANAAIPSSQKGATDGVAPLVGGLLPTANNHLTTPFGTLSTTVSGHTSQLASAVGPTQTFQNVGVARAVNTQYTNNTGRPIMVSAHAVVDAADGNIYGTVDGRLAQRCQLTNTGGQVPIQFWVPPGSTYQINTVNCTINSWYEYR